MSPGHPGPNQGPLSAAPVQPTSRKLTEPSRYVSARGTAKSRVVSVVDPQSCHAHKTAHSYRDGFKAHIAAEPDTGLVVAAELTAGDVGDANVAMGLLEAEPADAVVLADSAYGNGQLRADLRDAEMEAVAKAPPLGVAVQGGYSIDDFGIDYSIDPDSGEFSGTAACPEGHAVAITLKGNARFGWRCQRCPHQHRCSAADGRTIKINPPRHPNRRHTKPPTRESPIECDLIVGTAASRPAANGDAGAQD